jgi:hypothetical protein
LQNYVQIKGRVYGRANILQGEHALLLRSSRHNFLPDLLCLALYFIQQTNQITGAA